MRLESVDFTLQNRKSVVNRTMDVHFIEINHYIADRIEIENLKKIQKSAVLQKVCKLINTYLQTENEGGLGFRLWPPFARFSCALALKMQEENMILNNLTKLYP